jgi:hypothetical protein
LLLPLLLLLPAPASDAQLLLLELLLPLLLLLLLPVQASDAQLLLLSSCFGAATSAAAAATATAPAHQQVRCFKDSTGRPTQHTITQQNNYPVGALPFASHPAPLLPHTPTHKPTLGWLLPLHVRCTQACSPDLESVQPNPTQINPTQRKLLRPHFNLQPQHFLGLAVKA